MNQKPNALWSNFQLLGLALLFFVASCAFHIESARKGHFIYRDQHLGTALEYARTKIDLLRPIIVGFNANQTPTPQELPLWQAMTGLAFKMFGTWFGWANIVSLLIFATCLLPVFWMTRTFLGERCACWTLVFFLSQPLIFMYTGLASPDGLSIVSAIWFLFFGTRLVQNPRLGWWLLSCLTGAIAAVSKLPFFMSAGLTCFFLLWMFHRASLRAWVLLGSAGLLIFVCFLGWTHYTNHCIAMAEFPLVDLRVSNSDSSFWYFGDLHYRLVPGNWIKGGWRILNTCFGSFALVGLVGYAFIFLGQNAFPKLLLLGAILTTLVFTHLVLHHSHYYLMFTVALAILCAQTATDLEKKMVVDSRAKSNILLAMVAAVLALSLVQGLIGMKIVIHSDSYPYDMASIIRKYTSPSDKLLIEGGGWGGNELFLSDRNGLSIWNTKILEDPADFHRLKELGYNKLVMISESPLLTALQKINPGQTKLERQSYREFLTPVAKDWPTLFESDDILIKEIP